MLPGRSTGAGVIDMASFQDDNLSAGGRLEAGDRRWETGGWRKTPNNGGHGVTALPHSTLQTLPSALQTLRSGPWPLEKIAPCLQGKDVPGNPDTVIDAR